MTVQFTDNSTGSPTSWHWTFGDGGVNNTQNPVYTYTNAGTYTVTLTSTNAGGSVSLSKSGYVHVLSTAVNTQTYAYIPNFGNGTVSVVDIPHFRVIKIIAVGTQPYGVAVSPDGTRAYVTNYNNGAASTVSVIDTTPNTVGTTINVGNGAQSIVITPDNRKVYVANNVSNTVTVINGTTNTIMATIAGFSGPSGMAMSPSGDRVYVTNGGAAGTVSVINTATDTMSTAVSLVVFGGTPALHGVTVAPNGIDYYVASSGNNKVYDFWSINNTVHHSLTINNANQVATSVNGSVVYATSVGGSVLYTINNATMTQTNAVTLGNNVGTESVMADPFGVYTYVVGKSTNTMYYLYTDNNTFVGVNSTGFALPYAYGTFTRPIAAIATPITQFTANKTFGDTALTVQFNDTSLNAPTQWYWDFGDGGISAERNPVHTYTTVGAFTVSLTATNSAGSCASNKSYYIVTSQPSIPVAHFTGDPTYGGVPLTVRFTDTSTNNPTAWYWEFGDGNTSREQNPTHTYTSAAAFTVRLVSSNDAGSDQYQVSPYITAESHAPQSDFAADITYGTAPLSVNFTDLSTNAPTEWLWKFGDGGVSTQQNTTHVYTKSGVYTVMHWANNTNGADKRTKDYYIVVSSLTAPTYAYVPNYGAGTVSVVNLIGGDTIQTIPVGTNPMGVSVNSVGTEAYITNFNNSGDGTVSVINTTTNAVTNTINVGDGAYGIAIMPDCSKAYVTNSASNTVSVIDATSHSVISTIAGFNQPIGIAVNPAGTRAYVTNGAGTVSIINTGVENGHPVADTIIGNISSDVFGGGSPMLRDITVSLDGQVLYVASSGNNNVYAVWTQNNSRIYSVPSANANRMALTPDGESMYITSYQGTALRAINLSTGSPAATIPLGVASNTEGVTADPNGHYVYALGAASDTMYWVCTDNNTIVKTLNTFNEPYAFGNIMRQTSTPPVAPNANFTADKTYAWVGYPIKFTDLSAGLPDAWHWDFGDGNTSDVENPVHEFGMNASYTVSLIATNSHGSHNITKDYYITINDASAPGANFTATPTYGAIPLTVQFTDTSENNPRSWQWSFGDGGGSTERNPKHTYTTADAFTVSLTTENSAGDSTVTNEYYITTVAPTGAPMATFTANPTYGPFPLTVEFLDQSLGSPTSWLWDFGDGSTSTFMSPEHTYNATGSYTVKLTVSNDGGSDTDEQDYYITVTPSGGLSPKAGFVADVVTGIVPLSVQFTDQSTGNVSTWNWEFGDGSTSADQNPTHIYNVAGSYTVNLTVSNGDSLSNATSKGGYIYASATGGRPAPLPSNPAPVAGFTSNVTSGHTPFGVQFSDLTANSPTNWTWVFGDGSTSTDQNPIHTYSTAGRYDVTLVSVSPYGSNTVTKPSYIYSTNAYETNTTSSAAPVASFIKNSVSAGSSTVGGGGTTVVFNDTSTNSPTSWSWDFGDGTSSTEQNPIHTYEKAGDYAVTLTASNIYGSSTYTFNTSETPENYSQYVSKLFTRNMSGFDFLSHTVDFYTSFMPSWLFWCILLLIPFISMYNRQGGIILVGVLYLVTGGILSQVMPTVLGGAAFWFFVLGFAGILYKLFVPD
jgi:YVTN family beta-propeller protein